MFWEALRKLGINPHPIHEDDRVPQFYDTDQGLTLFTPKTAAEFLLRYAAEHGKEFVPMSFVYSKGEKSPGLYCELTVSHDEFGKSQMLRHAHSAVITAKLIEDRRLGQGEFVKISHAPLVTKDGRGVVKLDKVSHGITVNFDP